MNISDFHMSTRVPLVDEFTDDQIKVIQSCNVHVHVRAQCTCMIVHVDIFHIYGQAYLTAYNYIGEKSPDPRIAYLSQMNESQAMRLGCLLLQERNGLPMTGWCVCRTCTYTYSYFLYIHSDCKGCTCTSAMF